MMSTSAHTGHQHFLSADGDGFEHFNAAVGGGGRPYDPYPKLRALTLSGPVHVGMPELGITEQIDGANPTFTVFGFEAVQGAINDTDTFSSRAYGELVGAVIGRSLVEIDPPEHRAYRQILQQAFSRAAMERWEADTVRPLVRSIIDRIRDRGRAELVRDLCVPFPLQTIASLLGLPPEEHRLFHKLALELIGVTIDWDRAVAASESLRAFFNEQLERRRDHPTDDIISVLATAEHEGQLLTDEEIFAFLRLLLPAGAETTYRSSSSLVLGLLSHPEQFEALRQDRSLMPAAIDEAVRWETPLQFVPRTSTRDVDFFGVHIPAGSNVNLHIGSANHDESRWDDPDSFNIFRPRKPHIGFGHGVHTCLGMHLARMETGVAIDLLLDELPTLELDPDAPAPFMTGNLMRAAERVDVRW